MCYCQLNFSKHLHLQIYLYKPTYILPYAYSTFLTQKATVDESCAAVDTQ